MGLFSVPAKNREAVVEAVHIMHIENPGSERTRVLLQKGIANRYTLLKEINKNTQVYELKHNVVAEPGQRSMAPSGRAGLIIPTSGTLDANEFQVSVPYKDGPFSRFVMADQLVQLDDAEKEMAQANGHLLQFVAAKAIQATLTVVPREGNSL